MSGVRVLHVPGGHGYVASLHDPRVPGSTAVPGPAPATTWGPSPALDAAWVAARAAEGPHAFDVLHVHFGFETRTPEQLHALADALQRTGRGLVVTVHDLDNPHLTDQRAHHALLDVLVARADALVTLTEGAAVALETGRGRRPAVLPHPHVAPLARVGRPRPARSPRVVGVHLKSLRANLVPDVLPRLARAVREVDAVLRVDVHPEALDPGFVRHDPALTAWLRARHAAGEVDLHVRERLDDDALADHLAALDVSVLAYGHSTHSGWLELCHDLGTPVLAGRAGFLAQQRPVVTVDLHDDASVAAGLRAALARPVGCAADPRARDAERLAVAAAHRDLHRAAHRAARERAGTSA